MSDSPVAIVTGASRGIGRAIAVGMAGAGAAVVAASRDVVACEATVGEIVVAGGQGLAVACDVADRTTHQPLVDAALERFGRLDVLVNNAGIAEWASDDVGAFRKTLEANLFGVVAVTYALLPLLRESPAGRVVNHSSVLGSLTSITSAPGQFGDFVNPAYTTSKAALNGFTVALAHKLRGTRVKVNAAHPGWVKTDLGGDAAPLTVDVGAQTAVALATLGEDGPSGGFFHLGKPLPW